MNSKILLIVLLIAALFTALPAAYTNSSDVSDGWDESYDWEEDYDDAETVQYSLGFDASMPTGEGVVRVTVLDWEGNPVEEEYGSMELIGEEGMTIGEALDSWGYTLHEPFLEGDAFEGWMAYETVVTTDEDGWESYEYIRLPQEALYSTDELLAMPVPAYNVMYIAKWAGAAEEDYFSDEPMSWDAISTTGVFTLSAGEGVMTFSEPGMTYDAPAYTYWLGEGQSIRAVSQGEDAAWAAMTGASLEGKTLAGWTLYAAENVYWMDVPSEEEGELSFLQPSMYGESSYIILVNSTVIDECIPTDALLETVCTGTNYFAVAVWE